MTPPLSDLTATTRRYPRTLAEAFGPQHHLAPLVVDQDPMPVADRIVVAACVVGAIALAFAGLMGWLG